MLVLILGIVLLSLAVNGVLAVWSHYGTHRRGVQHAGVQGLVSSTLGRPLSVGEHATMMVLAVVNAACEECTARGFWRHEFEWCLVHAHASAATTLATTTTTGTTLRWSNLAQALIFGAWHYHGIPSGWTGVVLTTIYGGIMGFLADLHPSMGLLLPIVAHSIADYYIFAVIARQPKVKKS